MRKTTLYIISILLSVSVFSQEPGIYQNKLAQTYLDERAEVYFSFELSEKAQIQILSRKISIDQVYKTKDKYIIYAYANKKEFEQFKLFSLNYTVLIPPSMLHKAVMSKSVKNAKDWDVYPTYEDYVQMMSDFATNYPDLCILENIGSSVNGRDILVIKLSDNVEADESEPEFYFTSTMHGDETTGYPLMLRLIDYMLSNYETDEKVADILNNVELWINPLANPDGTYAGGNSTVNGATRSNANGVDLNRNYHDPQYGAHPDGKVYQVENIAQMDFLNNRHFVMSANFHGGAEVMNYPWDTWIRRHADDAWFRFTCHEYADTAQVNSPAGYMANFDDGITNGSDWYEIAGGRQDYVTYFLNGREVTIEISNTKNPPASSLPNFWNYNYRSFLNYINQCRYGIHGIVTDAISKNPVGAMVFIESHDADSSMVFSSSTNGDYHRLIEEGTWNLTFLAYGYVPQTIYNISTSNYETIITDIELVPAEAIDISGIITDGMNGMPIENAKIELLDIPLEAVFTNNEGYYIVNNILEGNYNIKVSKDDYTGFTELITVTADTNMFNFPLYPIVRLSFETGDFSEADFSFAGNAEWTIMDTIVYDGLYTARSGIIGNEQSTSLILNIDVLAAGQISFYKKVSSEGGYDYLAFYINGEKQGEWSGEVSWSEETYYISRGEHTLIWEYSKDYDVGVGQDAAWIDYITLPLIDTGQNLPPYFETFPETDAVINEEYYYHIFVNDLNDDTLEIECTQKPGWLNFEIDSVNSAILSGIPLEENIGIDTVILTVTDGIDTLTQNFNITVSPNLIIELENNPFNLMIYPNPAGNNINITYTSEKDNIFYIQILNSLGKTVLNNKVNSNYGINKQSINLLNLSNGLYFIILTDANTYSIKKFILTSDF